MKEITPRPETWLLWLLLATAVWCASGFCQAAHGQYCVDQFGNRVPCGNQGGWQSASYSQPQQQQPTPHPSRCRIHVALGGGMNDVGSGTLIDNRTGLIITCGHLFSDSKDGIVATFPNGRRFQAIFVAADPAADLAAIRIRPTDIETLPVDYGEQSGTLTAGGFGPNGQFVAATGQVVGRTQTLEGVPTTVISAPVRQGDSGGGVVSADRRFVGVVWGTRDGQTYLTSGRPLGNFLGRVLDRVLPNRPGTLIARSSPRTGNGSPGGQYAGQQPGYYGEGLEPVRPIPQPGPYQPGTQPPYQPYPPTAELDPVPQEPEPTIDPEAWDEWEQEQQEIKDGQDEIRNDLSVLNRSAKQQQQLTVQINQAVQQDAKLEGEQLEALQRISDLLLSMNEMQSQQTIQLTNIGDKLTKIESQPAPGTTAPDAGPQISYYDIVPRKKP